MLKIQFPAPSNLFAHIRGLHGDGADLLHQRMDILAGQHLDDIRLLPLAVLHKLGAEDNQIRLQLRIMGLAIICDIATMIVSGIGIPPVFISFARTKKPDVPLTRLSYCVNILVTNEPHSLINRRKEA